MLDAKEVVTEDEGSVITACASIVENTPIEREITVVISTINRDQQGTTIEPALMAVTLLTQNLSNFFQLYLTLFLLLSS